jgi:catechol-2,3-dioxygenase
VRFSRVTLEAPALYFESLARFYGDDLQLNIEHRSNEAFVFGLGETTIEFVARPGEPFYHFAALVPGNRFDQALDWISGQAIALPDPDSGEMRIDYDNWAASACYFHDPAGNIVELIAHRGLRSVIPTATFNRARSSACRSSGWSAIHARWRRASLTS